MLLGGVIIHLDENHRIRQNGLIVEHYVCNYSHVENVRLQSREKKCDIKKCAAEFGVYDFVALTPVGPQLGAETFSAIFMALLIKHVSIFIYFGGTHPTDMVQFRT